MVNTTFVDQESEDMVVETIRKDLVKMLFNNVVIVHFTKKDGTNREMKCTLKPSLVVPYEKKTDRQRNESNPEIVRVYDLDKQAWRTVNIDTITYLQTESED